MRLLVSVGTAAEALAALAGGADLIDAKDVRAGALGAVSVESLAEIYSTVKGQRPVTAALGDATDERSIEQAAHTFANTGAAFLKVGFAGIDSVRRVRSLTDAAARGVSAGSNGAGLVAVAYADASRVASLAPPILSEVAAGCAVDGLLIDTADKDGPGLRELVEPSTIARWVREAQKAGLFVALAGKLTLDDFGFVRDAGADIAGVRGAACVGGRIGRVMTERVRMLREQCASRHSASSIS